jgi:hypothetical protein
MPSSPRLVLVSNRLPVTVKVERGEVIVAQSAVRTSSRAARGWDGPARSPG